MFAMIKLYLLEMVTLSNKILLDRTYYDEPLSISSRFIGMTVKWIIFR